MRLCLRSQDLRIFSTAIVAADKTIVHEARHTETRPEAFFQLLTQDLASWEVPWSALTSIAVVTGPGSYTSLRTLATLANTLAFALGIQIVGVKVPEESQDEEVFPRLSRQKRAAVPWVTPVYAHAPHITKPKKSAIL